MNMREVANFFWKGNFTPFETACVNTFVKHNFIVNVWSYDNEIEGLPEGAIKKDAREILDESHLTKYGNHFRGELKFPSLVSFSDIFRNYLINKKIGEWWFDADIICIKDQKYWKKIKERPFVCGVQSDKKINDRLDLNNAVLYFSSKEYSDKFLNQTLNKIKEYNYITPDWGMFGPLNVQEFVYKNNLVNMVLPQECFFPISWQDFDVKTKIFNSEKHQTKMLNKITKNSHCVHLCNALISQHINKNNIKNSFLDKLL